MSRYEHQPQKTPLNFGHSILGNAAVLTDCVKRSLSSETCRSTDVTCEGSRLLIMDRIFPHYISISSTTTTSTVSNCSTESNSTRIEIISC